MTKTTEPTVSVGTTHSAFQPMAKYITTNNTKRTGAIAKLNFFSSFMVQSSFKPFDFLVKYVFNSIFSIHHCHLVHGNQYIRNFLLNCFYSYTPPSIMVDGDNQFTHFFDCKVSLSYNAPFENRFR